MEARGASGPLHFYKNRRLAPSLLVPVHFYKNMKYNVKKTKVMKILNNDEGLKIVIDA